MSSSRPAVPEPTEIAGRYQIVQKLGAGAFGTVYKARDTRLDRMVAIKTIRLEGLAASQSSLEDLLKGFKQEAQVAARLRHPNVVMLYDINTWEGMSYISMEYVDGVGLDRVIKSIQYVKQNPGYACPVDWKYEDNILHSHPLKSTISFK